jgi:actin-related protein 10
MPGFIPRLRLELLRALARVAPTAKTTELPMTSRSRRHRPRRPRATFATRFSALSPLLPHLAILNDTCSFVTPDGPPLPANAGCALPFSPALLGWIGGSLAGALKTGGVEVLRDRWDEAGILQGDGENGDGSEDEDDLEEKEETRRRRRAACLPDWLGPLVR